MFLNFGPYKEMNYKEHFYLLRAQINIFSLSDTKQIRKEEVLLSMRKDNQVCQK